MLDFIATPFMVVAQAMLWIAALITGRMYVLMEIEEDDQGDYNGD